MDMMYFSENLVRLRKQRKITQEQLAEFCGVTKASVSKWETRQSMPDISLLPLLAGFFDVTIDELLGYKPDLSREQIRKIYLDFTKAFVEEDFDIVMQKSRDLVKKYYSCYEFLMQMVCLWINHCVTQSEEIRTAILQEGKNLCNHVLETCGDIRLCNDVVLLRATIDLQLGNPEAVIEALEEVNDPGRLATQGEEVLIEAYLQAGQIEKANDFTQITMYNHLLALVSDSCQYLQVHEKELERCEETYRKVAGLAEYYNLEKLNFNCMVNFYYMMAIVFCKHHKKQEAIEQIEKYVLITLSFLEKEESHLQSDSYFDRLGVWFERTALGDSLPRDKKLILQSVKQSLETPTFEILKKEEAFINLKAMVNKREEKDYV